MDKVQETFTEALANHSVLSHRDSTHLIIEVMRLKASKLVKGLKVDVVKRDPGLLNIEILVKEKMGNPVHLCFGVLPQEGREKIQLKLHVEDGAGIEVLAHSSFQMPSRYFMR